eukprot:TRINITY_DN1706_c1_g1_i1.p1 TRINITY_DN1706_c1_g1~~TRINITY_DN1706_c1_g1_i1.p1  ORF type:complete len:602 (+),score=235.24 TRINITY_DN1706_c1_g1_i1:46-1806(+)
MSATASSDVEVDGSLDQSVGTGFAHLEGTVPAADSTVGLTGVGTSELADLAALEAMGHRSIVGDDYTYAELLADHADARPRHRVTADDIHTESSSDIDVARLNIGQRLYYIGCGMERNRQERLRRERETAEMAELSQLTAKPMITPRARRLPEKGDSFAHFSELWAKRNERQKRQQAARQAQEEAAEVLKQVEMNPYSKKLVEREGTNYQGPISGWNKHFARHQTKKNATPAAQLFTPCINPPLPDATGREGDKDIGTRLFEESAKREKRMRDRVHAMQRDLEVDPVTKQRLFVPQTGRTSAGSVHGSSPRSDATRSRDPSPTTRAKAALRERPGRAVKAELERVEERRRQLREKRDTTFDRLRCDREKREVARRRAKSEQRVSGRSQVWFQPEINEWKDIVNRKPLFHDPRKARSVPLQAVTSPNVQRRKGNFKAFVDRNQKMLQSRWDRVRTLEAMRDLEEQEHCTFTPNINRHSDSIFNGAPVRAAGALGTGARRDPVPRYDADAERRAAADAALVPHPRDAVAAAARDARPDRSVQLAGARITEPPRATAVGGAGAEEGGEIEAYVASFEQVLKEWERLEDV